MGNEGSKLKGILVEENAVETNKFWTVYNAKTPATTNDERCSQMLSVFEGKVFVKAHVWSNGVGPIERAIKNLMVYRHPYILKYIATWEKSGRKYLATERVRPLDEVLAQQTDIEVCLGLRTILCALIFLVEKAHARHLNINTQSIYVTESGSWRLAGFEYVWRATDVNKQLLDLAHSFIDLSIHGENFEQFFFSILCEKVLSRKGADSCITDSTPHVQEFREYCSTHLKHQNTKLRPRLSAILLHPYFNHEFVLIHSFLFELPLKSVHERHKFFRSLIDRLRYFDEEVVASQLACDLLSRMVLLDPAAQEFVTPHILRTKVTDKAPASLFSPQIYVQYLMPHILKMFRLRDAQIRLILLDYFMDYVRLLSDEQLESEILPHLQLGMNDTNDVLVGKTLRCMADLVSILGANKVLGGDRTRCFSDGRPHAAVSRDSTNPFPEPRSISPLMNTRSFDVEDFMVSASPLPQESNASPLSIRLSPDGGEDEKVGLNSNEKSISIKHNIDPERNSNISGTEHEKVTNVDEEGTWLDWDNTDHLQQGYQVDQAPTDSETNSNALTREIQISKSLSPSYRTGVNETISQTEQKVIDDLSELDIKVQTVIQRSELHEFDFFKDMEPTIEIRTSTCETPEQISSRFAAAASAVNCNELCADQGWGHDEQDKDDIVWGVTNASTL
ncbi:protein-associating with the carboxyl-terminal domain of ezrin [Drosophila sechellia]|uniref:GM16513 n=1 Tax=Drosophila sechellia TaxID=7238 RepID=B4IHZ7_DROSE|nr:protein-associating with the carboxyl-terminal domain of ezrin [Drosophila sechellia]EDW49523.1 GM16513 [Drosophila sechellia]